jgi:hypothetical protein
MNSGLYAVDGGASATERVVGEREAGCAERDRRGTPTDRFARLPDRGVRGRCRRRGVGDGGLVQRMTDPLFDLELDLDRTSVRGRNRFFDQREMVVLQPLTDEGARNGQREDIVDEAGGSHVGEPHHECRIGELCSRAGQHT